MNATVRYIEKEKEVISFTKVREVNGIDLSVSIKEAALLKMLLGQVVGAEAYNMCKTLTNILETIKVFPPTYSTVHSIVLKDSSRAYLNTLDQFNV